MSNEISEKLEKEICGECSEENIPYMFICMISQFFLILLYIIFICTVGVNELQSFTWVKKGTLLMCAIVFMVVFPLIVLVCFERCSKDKKPQKSPDQERLQKLLLRSYKCNCGYEGIMYTLFLHIQKYEEITTRLVTACPKCGSLKMSVKTS